MSKSSRLGLRHHSAIRDLIDDCRTLGDDNASWRLRYLEGVARLVGADVSLGGELFGLAAGLPQAVSGPPSVWGIENGFDRRGLVYGMELFEADPSYSCQLRGYFAAGALAGGEVLRGSDVVGRADWQRSVEYDVVYRTAGVDRSMFGFRLIPGRPDEGLGGFWLRARARADFSPRDAAIVREVNLLLAPTVGGSLARLTEPSPGTLPPRVRRVLRCVLEGGSDKQIATRLGISKFTVNQHTKAIHRHFGVQSRPELLARWIRRGWGARFAWADA